MSMYETFGFAVPSADGPFGKIAIKRNTPGDDDVQFDIKYCGVCHSDVHAAKNDMGRTKYPFVGGHELSGLVTKVGKNVANVKVGDKVGVGCIVDSCMNCKFCGKGDEHFCEMGMTGTYNNDTVHGHLKTDSGYTYGGYSGKLTVPQRFIVRIPDSVPLEAAGPIFCAGITMYSPLGVHGATKGGMRVGILGIGGLGQMGIKLAAAMGNTVTAISTSPRKEAVAREIGADHFVVSTDPESMKTAAGSLDLILNTVSATHEISTYLPLLARSGTIVQLGLSTNPHSISVFPLILRQVKITGSMIGGMRETQECIDFCAKHNILPTTQLITADKLDEVYKTLQEKNDLVVRYVIDIPASNK